MLKVIADVLWRKRGQPPNYTRYNNHAFDSLYMAAVTETIPAERIRLYRQMDSLMMQEAPHRSAVL